MFREIWWILSNRFVLKNDSWKNSDITSSYACLQLWNLKIFTGSTLCVQYFWTLGALKIAFNMGLNFGKLSIDVFSFSAQMMENNIIISLGFKSIISSCMSNIYGLKYKQNIAKKVILHFWFLTSTTKKSVIYDN